jgi:hypothetical protein
MIRSLSQLLNCSIPCIWTLACLAGFALHRMIVKHEIYFKQIPVDGFPSDTERRAFYVDSVLDQRRRKSFKTLWIWPSIWVSGALVGFVLISFFSSFHIVRADANVTATPIVEVRSEEQPTP